MADARIGTGTTLTMGTTDIAMEIVSISQGDMSTPSVDVTHLSSTTREFIPGDLADFGELTMEANIDPDLLDSFKTAIGLDQTMTLTFPTITGETSGATMAGSGFVTGGSFNVPLEDKLSGSFTMKWSGDVTFTDAT